MLELYQRVLAEDDFEIADIVQSFIDGLFVDDPETNNANKYGAINWARIGLDATRPDANEEDKAQAGLAFPQIQNLFGPRRWDGLNDGLTRNIYPIEVLLAVSTIYLDTSCNTTDLLGTSFKMATFAADELLKKFYNPII